MKAAPAERELFRDAKSMEDRVHANFQDVIRIVKVEAFVYVMVEVPGAESRDAVEVLSRRVFARLMEPVQSVRFKVVTRKAICGIDAVNMEEAIDVVNLNATNGRNPEASACITPVMIHLHEDHTTHKIVW